MLVVRDQRLVRLAYIIDGVRTPIARYAGALSALRTDDLAALPIAELIKRNPDIDWAKTDDVIYGAANQAGEDNRNVARMAALLAGLPIDAPGITVNRLCASGMDAVGLAARGIKAGDYTQAIAGGVESMSRAPFVMPKAHAAFSRSNTVYDTTIGWRFVNPRIKEQYGTESMPETGDNVAEDYNISREDQDAFAERSQHRYAVAHAAGLFNDELMQVSIPQRKGDAVVVEKDEHPRPGTKIDALSALKPINASTNGFEKTVTAGNASGVNDGAAALLLGDESLAKLHSPLARVVGMCASGVEPRVMGIGPVSASEKLLKRNGLTIEQMDVIELNEAFASQALATMRALGLPDDAEHVNPNGGAIALGHPLGMSGARLVLTAAYQLKRSGGRYALCTMCVGVGQGVALLLEKP